MVVSDQPARAAQADLKRRFTQMSECPFSCVASHLMSAYPVCLGYPLSKRIAVGAVFFRSKDN